MKYIKYLFLICLLATVQYSCTIDEQIDPNAPSLNGVGTNATISQLNNLVTGTLSQMRDQINVYYDAVGVIGRDMYRFSGSDPRWVADLLNGALDNNAFYTTRVWGAKYRTVKNTNILIDAVNNTGAGTDAERQGYLGFAKTIQAHELLITLNMQNDNGIRVNISDPDNLGPIVGKAEALTNIAGLLDEGATHLSNAGNSFAFSLTSGFSDFNTPSTFIEFNQALAARVAVYRGQYAPALTFLGKSFMDETASLNAGSYMVFSSSAGDAFNSLFLPRDNTGEVRAAHPSFITDAEAGDTRVSKAPMRIASVQASDLSSDYDVFIYQSNVDPVPVIRNEELLLIAAEASIQTDALTEATTFLNIIRNAHDLDDYAGLGTKEALIDEMLLQRRYSLWNEGHRWVDMRRYDRLGELPLDRVGDLVHTSFPIPQDDDF
ncbi:MAG: hypothetical protein ACI9XO_001108 [Paraglaciecola sp.]|jgi:hypothetical protein